MTYLCKGQLVTIPAFNPEHIADAVWEGEGC